MPLEFFRWELASLIFFAYVLACAFLLRGLTPAARAKSAIGCLTGAGIVLLGAAIQPADQTWRGLLLPALALLLAYWTSGLLFRAPMPRVESFLRQADATLRIRETAASAPRVTAEFLEFAYAAVYALIPIALVLYLLLTPPSLIDVDRFWTVVLVTDFICFGMLPWIQSRPPRTVEGEDPWRSSFRRFNLRVLGSASIHVNTCPSGHAAEALVAALLVSSAPAPVFAAVLFAAAAVSAGAVYGRYHYALDAVSGWMVALGVWVIVAAA
jgi:membrane-associated phospholipid phosphatase